MLRLVVADYKEENETIDGGGTCDHCMGQIDVFSARWTFRDVETGETATFAAQEWTWNDMVLTMPQCSNIPAFSQWLSTSTEAQKVLKDCHVHSIWQLDRYTIERLLQVSGYIKEED